MQRVFWYYRGIIVGKMWTSTFQLFVVDGAIWIHRKWDNKPIQFWIHEISSRHHKGLRNSIHCPQYWPRSMKNLTDHQHESTIVGVRYLTLAQKDAFFLSLPQFCGNVLLNLKSGICLTCEVESFSGFWVVISLIIQPVFAFQHPSIC